MRARHGLSKFLLRSGQRPPTGVRCWTRSYLIWFAQVRFNQVAQEVTRQEIEHMRLRPSWARYPVMGYAVGYLAKTPVASESDDRMSSLARPTISSYLSDNHEGRELSTAKRRSFWVLGHLDYRRRSLVYATDRYVLFCEPQLLPCSRRIPRNHLFRENNCSWCHCRLQPRSFSCDLSPTMIWSVRAWLVRVLP
jgi:hypothetical protein